MAVTTDDGWIVQYTVPNNIQSSLSQAILKPKCYLADDVFLRYRSIWDQMAEEMNEKSCAFFKLFFSEIVQLKSLLSKYIYGFVVVFCFAIFS